MLRGWLGLLLLLHFTSPGAAPPSPEAEFSGKGRGYGLEEVPSWGPALLLSRLFSQDSAVRQGHGCFHEEPELGNRNLAVQSASSLLSLSIQAVPGKRIPRYLAKSGHHQRY